MARNLILNNPKHIRILTPLNDDDDVAFSFFDFYLAQETIFPFPPARPIGSRRTFLLTVMWYITTHVSLVCSLFFAGACHSPLSRHNEIFHSNVEMPERRQWKRKSRGKQKIAKNEPSIASFVVRRVLRLPFLVKCFLFRGLRERWKHCRHTIPANREKSCCALLKSIKRRTIKAPLGAY